MGQLPVRTGMTTIGIPWSTRGIQKVDPTLAEVLKTQGYATARSQTVWDRNEFLPTVHGFDERSEPLPPQCRGGARASSTTRVR